MIYKEPWVNPIHTMERMRQANLKPGEVLDTSKLGKISIMPDEIHPAPTEFTDEQLNQDPILRYFYYRHLPPALQEKSVKFFELALFIVTEIPRNPERTVALRKLLEAKDAGVRANVG